jgi:hypothetical protein
VFDFVPKGLDGGFLGRGASQGAGEDLFRGGRLGSGGVFVAGWFGDDAAQVVVAASGHADVQVFGGGVSVDDEHPLVDGDPLASMHGDDVGEADMLASDIVAWHCHDAPTVQGVKSQCPAPACLFDRPAVAVSHPSPGGSDQAAVVEGGDDFVANTDGLVGEGDPAGLDFAGVPSLWRFTMPRRHFGSVRKLPSGRYQASYWHQAGRHIAGETFLSKGDAQTWLSGMETEIKRGAWVDPIGGPHDSRSARGPMVGIRPWKAIQHSYVRQAHDPASHRSDARYK